MITFYKSEKFPNVMYYRTNGLVGLMEAKERNLYFTKYYSHLNDVIIVIDVGDDVVLSHKTAIREIAKSNEKYKDRIKAIHIIGLKGILKIFYRVYHKLLPTKSVEIILEKTREDVEETYHFSLESDFEKV